MSDQDAPKIIIDDDWKAQAQAEKAKLAEQEKAKAAASGPSGGSPGSGLPEKIGFQDLVQVMASQALMYMGAPDPQTGKSVISLPMAKIHIDLLGVIEEKTKGNLDEAEAKLLGDILREIRSQFVEFSAAVQQAIKEGKIKPMQAGEIGDAGNPSDPGTTSGAGPIAP